MATWPRSPPGCRARDGPGRHHRRTPRGLLDATDAYRDAGLPAARAAAAAIGEFGDPRQVAAAFRPELAISQARRVALTLLATGPLIGLLWVAAAVASHIGIRHAPPWQWAGAPPASREPFPLAAAAMADSGLDRAFHHRRHRPGHPLASRPPPLAPGTAAIAGLGAAAADLALFVLLASQLAAAPSTLSPPRPSPPQPSPA